MTETAARLTGVHMLYVAHLVLLFVLAAPAELSVDITTASETEDTSLFPTLDQTPRYGSWVV
jgi:hypothetical protein